MSAFTFTVLSAARLFATGSIEILPPLTPEQALVKVKAALHDALGDAAFIVEVKQVAYEDIQLSPGGPVTPSYIYQPKNPESQPAKIAGIFDDLDTIGPPEELDLSTGHFLILSKEKRAICILSIEASSNCDFEFALGDASEATVLGNPVIARVKWPSAAMALRKLFPAAAAEK